MATKIERIDRHCRRPFGSDPRDLMRFSPNFRFCQSVKFHARYILCVPLLQQSDLTAIMNSCFPPLAALTLKDKRRNSAYLQETVGNQNTGKPNVIQDMEMFYIKQIAHNLKVRTKKKTS